MLKLSIVIPVYNEAATIEAIINRVLALSLPFPKRLSLLTTAPTTEAVKSCHELQIVALNI